MEEEIFKKASEIASSLLNPEEQQIISETATSNLLQKQEKDIIRNEPSELIQHEIQNNTQNQNNNNDNPLKNQKSTLPIVSFSCEVIQEINNVTVTFQVQSRFKKINLYAEKENDTIIYDNYEPYIEITPPNQNISLLKFQINDIIKINPNPFNKASLTLVIADRSNNLNPSNLQFSCDVTIPNFQDVLNQNYKKLLINNADPSNLSMFSTTLQKLIPQKKDSSSNINNNNAISQNIIQKTQKQQTQNKYSLLQQEQLKKFQDNISKNQQLQKDSPKKNSGEFKINNLSLKNNKKTNIQQQLTPFPHESINDNSNNFNYQTNNQLANKVIKRKGIHDFDISKVSIQIQEEKKLNYEKQQQNQSLISLKQQKQTNFHNINKNFKFFDKINKNIILTIFQFMQVKEKFQLRLISKYFEALIWDSIKSITFNEYSDIEVDKVVSLMQKSVNIQNLKLGKFVKITLEDFISINPQYPKLLHADFSLYNKMTDKILKLFYQNCKNIRTLVLPYNSKITDESILILNYYLKDLKSLEFKSFQSSVSTMNDKVSKVTEASIIKNVLFRSINLKKLNLYCADQNLLISLKTSLIKNLIISKDKSENQVTFNQQQHQQLQILQEENLYSEDVQKLQSNLGEQNLQILSKFECLIIKNLILPNNSLYFLEILSIFKNLTKLKLINIFFKTQTVQLINQIPISSKFIQILKSFEHLQYLSLGNYCTNQLLNEISPKLVNLKTIKIQNNDLINDSGVTMILINCILLQYIDISKCKKITGQCFENIASQHLQKIEINFDDYTMNQVFNMLKEGYPLHKNLTIINQYQDGQKRQKILNFK